MTPTQERELLDEIVESVGQILAYKPKHWWSRRPLSESAKIQMSTLALVAAIYRRQQVGR